MRNTQMKLYYSPGACSLSPHIAMREAGLPVELVKVDLANKTAADGTDYRKVNAKGYVPALEVARGRVLTEGPAIVQYIADQNPAANLAPKAGSFERYQLQEWLNFITSDNNNTFGTLSNKDAPTDWKATATTALKTRLGWLDQQLEGKQYLMGDQFTVADAYLFTVVNWTRFVGMDLKEWPMLAQYQARVAARPKVQEALKAEGLA